MLQAWFHLTPAVGHFQLEERPHPLSCRPLVRSMHGWLLLVWVQGLIQATFFAAGKACRPSSAERIAWHRHQGAQAEKALNTCLGLCVRQILCMYVVLKFCVTTWEEAIAEEGMSLCLGLQRKDLGDPLGWGLTGQLLKREAGEGTKMGGRQPLETHRSPAPSSCF